MRIDETGEFPLISRIAAAARAAGVAPATGQIALGIGDDAALLAVPQGHQLAATTDFLVEEIHFRREWTGPEDLGWKALAVNVSDLGAMGAAPVAAIVSLALPGDLTVEWVDGLYRGLLECGEAYGCPVAGGDTVRSPRGVAINVAALGSVPAGAALTRAGARPGELLCVTGTLGESAAGLELLRAGRTPATHPAHVPLFAAHLRPQPPLKGALALAGTGAVTAMLDLSDGLASDVRRLAERSGVGARLACDRLPISLFARRAAEELRADPVEWALRGGEDFQYLFTLPPERFEAVPPLLAPLGVTATIVGEVLSGSLRLVLEEGSEQDLPGPAFEHFAASGIFPSGNR